MTYRPPPFTGGTVTSLTSTGALGAWGAAGPGAQPAAYTQAGPAAARAMAATTAVAPAATAATNVGPYGYTQAQADAIKNGVINIINDHNALAAVVRQLVVDLKAYGLTA